MNRHIDQFHRERNTNVFYKTKGYTKLLNFLQDFIRKEKFTAFVECLRKKYDIAPDGFDLGKPPYYVLPLAWEHRRDTKMVEDMRQEIKDFCAPYHLPSKDWMSVIEGYVFYNKVSIPINPNSHNLCYVTDMLTKQDSLGMALNDDIVNCYPVSVMISPYASERDIVDYIKKMYTTQIRPLQQNHQNKELEFVIGKSKTKRPRTRMRNDTVHKNRNLPLNKINALLEYQNITDPGHIGAIKSRERKKRQEV